MLINEIHTRLHRIRVAALTLAITLNISTRFLLAPRCKLEQLIHITQEITEIGGT